MGFLTVRAVHEDGPSHDAHRNIEPAVAIIRCLYADYSADTGIRFDPAMPADIGHDVDPVEGHRQVAGQ